MSPRSESLVEHDWTPWESHGIFLEIRNCRRCAAIERRDVDPDDDYAARCGVCGGDGNGPCQTPSGRHWYERGGAGSPMPEPLRIALTDPALRTADEQAALARWSK